MIDVFTLLLGIILICSLAGAAVKIMLTPPKVWDEEDWIPFEIEDVNDYEETDENKKPHVWMD